MLDAKLDTLLTVYNEKSFTAAADKLNLTQPAISNHIHMLEREIGHPLCVRTKKEVHFTPEGEIAVNYATELKNLYQDMRKEIVQNQAAPTTLRIGMIQSISDNYSVLNGIGAHIDMHPQTHISIRTDSIHTLTAMLEQYELDLVIADTPPVSPQLCAQILETDHLVCLVGRNNPLFHAQMITLEELKKEPLITWPLGTANRQLFESSLEQIGASIDEFNIVLELSSTSTIKLLVSKDVGVAIVPKDISSGTSKYTRLPIENLSTARDIYLIHRKDFSQSDIIQTFTQTVKNAQTTHPGR